MRHLFTFALFAVIAGLPSSADAQIVSGSSFRLTSGPCTQRSGSGTPEGATAGKVCDTYRDNATGEIYQKIIGAAGTNTGWYRIVGPSAATCTTFAACVAASLETDYLCWTQKLRTDGSYALRSCVTTSGARLEAYSGTGWLPLKLAGGPTRIIGGGFHVGATEILDPGLGNAQIDGFIGHPDYASQTLKWRIDNAGAADFRYGFFDEIHAKSFIADLEQALAGGQIISKSVAVVGAPFTVPAGGSISTLTVKDLPSAANMAVFEAGDYVRVRQFSRASGSLSITDGWGTVTSYTDLADGLQSWTFTRLVTNGGAMATGAVIDAESLVLDYGLPGNGFYEVNAIDGLYGVNSPYAQIVTWSGDSPIAANQSVRARFGNLRGITGTTDEFGLLAGTYAATDGQYFRASNEAFELHGINLSLWDGATKVIELNRTAPSLAMGVPAPTTYSAGTGLWAGLDGGTFKFRIGTPGGQGVFWDGVTLDVNGAIDVSEGGTIGGWSVLTSSLTDLAGVVGMSSAVTGGDDVRFYAGHATPTSAPFRVTEAGALTATNATITGAVTATSGAIGAFTINTHLYTGSKTAYNDGLAGVHVGSDGIGLGSTFSVSAAGALTSTNATITGAITATSGSFTGSITSTSGTIGGWTMGATALTAGTGANTVALDSGGTNPAFYAGSATPGSAPFRVTKAGALTATNATITGTITGSTITGSTISAAGGDVTISEDGLTFDAGSFESNQIKWTDGSWIQSSADILGLRADDDIALSATDDVLILAQGGISLNSDSIALPSLLGTTAADYPLVFAATPSFEMKYKTDGSDGTFCGASDFVETITIERGIVTGVTCATPAPEPAAVAALRREVSELRALVASLLNQSAVPARAQR